MNRKLILAAGGACILGGCSESADTRPDFSAEVRVDPGPSVDLASTAACALDSDCAAGLFCFQGGCARQCANDSDCGEGVSCSPRGRCGASADAGPIDVDPGRVLVEVPARIQRVAPAR